MLAGEDLEGGIPVLAGEDLEGSLLVLAGKAVVLRGLDKFLPGTPLYSTRWY